MEKRKCVKGSSYFVCGFYKHYTAGEGEKIADQQIAKTNQPLQINLWNKSTSYALLDVTLNDSLLDISLLSCCLGYVWPNKKKE